MTTSTIEAPGHGPETAFWPATVWARSQGIGINAVYEYCRREIDPMPHIKRGRNYLIDHEAALKWLRRKFGHGYGKVGR